MKISEFLPIFKLRAPNIMLLLGAGASVSAGIPTAWDMIWDFKRTIFCAENKKPLSYCQDLSNSNTRTIIQDFFDAKESFPTSGSDVEYAHFFETLYPNEGDRRRYIDLLISGAKPSYGHLVLASFLKLEKIRIVWTTNFDRTIEDATVPLYGSSGALVTANLDNARVAQQALNEGRWPLLVKLHGDFQSTELKNTSDELKKQDSILSDSFIEGCKRYGLAVMGYSGRDKSVIDALQEAVNSGKGFPGGLFWFYRSESPPFEGVEKLIGNAVSKGIDAHLVEMETFDELMGDMLLLEENLPSKISKYIDQSPKRISSAPLKQTSGTYPIIRLNAIQVLSWPSTCRRLVCNIGGLREVRDAVKQSDVNLIVARRKEGVLFFGSDNDAKKAFSQYGIKTLDIHTLLIKKIRYDSQEQGLLYEALAYAIGRNTSLRVKRKRSSYYLVIPDTNVNNELYNSLKTATYNLSGLVPNTNFKWAESVYIKVEYKHDRFWLLLVPSIWLDWPEFFTDKEKEAAKDFVRERGVRRYNPKYNEIISAWISILTKDNDFVEYTTFGIQDGKDANFTLSRGTAFSQKES